MSVAVTMPRLGESVSEGTVTRWLKQEGERVEADEPLLEVSTDKVDTEIPAPASGVLASIKVGEDETVEVGAELATIDDGNDGAPAGQAVEQPAGQPTDRQPSGQDVPPAQPPVGQDNDRPVDSARRAGEQSDPERVKETPPPAAPAPAAPAQAAQTGPANHP